MGYLLRTLKYLELQTSSYVTRFTVQDSHGSLHRLASTERENCLTGDRIDE
jgi:hypothetical protein